MGEIAFFFFWVALSGACAAYASRLGRDVVGWLFVALLLSPLIAIAYLLALGDNRPAK